MARLNVIFVSTLQDINGLDLPDILADTRKHNPSDSLRSMLLFSGGQLMQVIDGEVAEARRELRRIWADPYYCDSVVINEELMQAPSLCGTSLGAVHLPAAVIEQIRPPVTLFTLTETAVSQRLGPGIARKLLQQFACDYS